MKTRIASLLLLAALPCSAQNKEDDAPSKPQPIVPGGILLPLYPPDSTKLNRARLHEPEKYNTATGGKGPITNVINIHNPTIEVHLAKDGPDTGTAVIVVPGGGHKILWVGPEGGDYVPLFAKLGVTTVILRNRLRIDGYEPTTDAVNDAFQAIRLVRSHAFEWKLDSARIGIVGFSAGAELASATALAYDRFAKENDDPSDPLAKISARPDFVGLLYPGPTPFTKAPDTPIPADVPPAFIACSGSGDRVHALWAADYFNPMLRASVPNLEMHIYGRGGHGVKPNEPIPYATWRDRYLDWFRDLGFLEKSGTETKAAREVAAHAKKKRD